MALEPSPFFTMSNEMLTTPPPGAAATTGALVVAGSREQQLATYQPAHSMAPPPQPPAAPVPAVHTQAQESVISLADLVGYMRKHWCRGLLFGLPLAVLAFVSLGMGPKVFQAEAQLLLRIQDSNVFNFEQLGRSSAVGELSAPLLVNNHLMELKSRSFLEFFHDSVPVEVREQYITPDLTRKSFKTIVMDWAGLSKPKAPPNHREVFIRKLGAVTRVEPLKESFILRVQVRGEEPLVCADMANRYVNRYIEYVAQQELSGTRAASEFLTQKAAELRKQLQDSEAKLAAYRQQASVMSRADGVKDTSGEKLTALNQALADTEVKLTRARYELEAIEAAGTSQVQLLSVQSVAQNAQVSQKRIEISALEAQLTPLLEFCGPRHPRVVGIGNELRTRKTELNTLIGSVVIMARQEVATLTSQLEDFKRQVSGTRGDVIAMGDKEIQEKMLIDQVELDRQMYQNISMRMNQANLTGQFTDNGLLRIADVATPPDKALKPNKTLAALASMMVFGLVFVGVPLGWGLTEDHLIKPLRAAAGAEGSSTATPGVDPAQSAPAGDATGVPALPPPVALSSGNRTTVLAEFPRLAVDGHAEVLAECLKSEPRGAATSLRQLTGVLEKQALYRTGPGGIVLVTSSESGEGKSLAAAALAATFVHHGRKVLVIDCHAGAPGIHHFFPQSERHSSGASRLDDIRYGHSGLFVLPAHDIPAYETNELLDGYRAWIDRARLEVDWIILDGPPVLKNFADVAPLAPLATDVIMIHDRARATPAKLRAAMTLLQPMMSSSAMRGLVINRAE
jgi:uncharacterized protein involved in exopolysaccharide biosynthesis/Mrp family chromosome partitioning ATPase